MVDLRSQYKHIRRKLRKRLRKVIKESAFINGNEVKLFQQNLEQYLGVRHVIPCASGTEALQIALMALPLEEGDEVIIPDFTFVSAAEVACLLGLRPVFVDIDPQTFVMDPAAVERAVTERTRVIVPTHLFGQCTNMAAIMEIAEKYGVSATTVSKWLKHAGCEIRRKALPMPSAEELRALCQDHTAAEIAEMYGVSATTVGRWRKKACC